VSLFLPIRNEFSAIVKMNPAKTKYKEVSWINEATRSNRSLAFKFNFIAERKECFILSEACLFINEYVSATDTNQQRIPAMIKNVPINSSIIHSEVPTNPCFT